MSDGAFIILGALVGLIGATIGAFVISISDARRQRAEERQRYRGLVREVASDFLLPIVRLRQARIQLRDHPGEGDDDIRRQMDVDDHSVRYEMDRIRITVESIKVQASARFVVRYAHGLCREVKGQPPREDEKDKEIIVLLEEHIYEFERDVREELGLSREVFEDPWEWGPGQQRTEEADEEEQEDLSE